MSWRWSARRGRTGGPARAWATTAPCGGRAPGSGWPAPCRPRRPARAGWGAPAAAGALGPRVPVRTIYNAVDLERFAPAPEDGDWLDEACSLPRADPGTVRVGLVATFAVWKGHGVFLDAVARIAADRPCRFYIVGG